MARLLGIGSGGPAAVGWSVPYDVRGRSAADVPPVKGAQNSTPPRARLHAAGANVSLLVDWAEALTIRRREAMFRDYFVRFLADATGTCDYPDVGWGAMSAAEVHAATLTILAFSTADVMTVADLWGRMSGDVMPERAEAS